MDNISMRIACTKADEKGKIISQMAKGVICSYPTEAAALKMAEEFILLVKSLAPGKFTAYGLIFCQDEATGAILWTVPIK